MLREDVVETIKSGQFHLYPVKTIDQGIEILTGRKAGIRKLDGKFEKDSVNELVDQKLLDFALKLKDFGAEKEKK
ncbi:MAG: hypothetical protein BWY64_04092 [bacterium ADurb.Bin363]|nr:MAG: hypothetical protein BWY64_04092 [bacterium ADurb.Bin363]